MIELGSLIKLCRPGDLPVYIQIVEQIGALIRDGVLCPGVQIQPSRELARSLRLHRNTVVAAYGELEAQKLGLFIRDGKRHNPPGMDLNAICIGFASLNLEELRELLRC